MPVPSAITDLSQTPGSNSPAGSESPALLDDYTRTVFSFIAKLRDGQGLSNPVDLASAATTDIGAQTSPIVRITGTTTITSFGTNYAGHRFLTFAGALTLTHNATSLILPGGANITTASGDCAIAVPNAATPNGWRVIAYQKANGGAVTVDLSVATGALGIANGGTGQTTAAAGFNAIKQAATETATGVVELATTAEAEGGSDSTRAVTAAGVEAHMVANALGWGQTLQDVTGSRALGGGPYTNNTGRPILVTVTATSSGGSGGYITPTVASVAVGDSAQGYTSGARVSISFVVGNGESYSVAGSSAALSRWTERR